MLDDGLAVNLLRACKFDALHEQNRIFRDCRGQFNNFLSALDSEGRSLDIVFRNEFADFHLEIIS